MQTKAEIKLQIDAFENEIQREYKSLINYAENLGRTIHKSANEAIDNNYDQSINEYDKRIGNRYLFFLIIITILVIITFTISSTGARIAFVLFLVIPVSVKGFNMVNNRNKIDEEEKNEVVSRKMNEIDYQERNKRMFNEKLRNNNKI